MIPIFRYAITPAPFYCCHCYCHYTPLLIDIVFDAFISLADFLHADY